MPSPRSPTSLHLTPRTPAPRVVAVGHVPHEVVDVHLLHHLAELRLRAVLRLTPASHAHLRPVDDVRANRAREQHGLLRHDTDHGANEVARQVVHVHAVQQHLAARHAVEPANQRGDGALAGTRAPHDPNVFARMRDDVYPSVLPTARTDVVEHLVLRVLRVREAHVAQHHLALEPIHVRDGVVRYVVHTAVEALQTAGRRRLERVRAQFEHALRRAERLRFTPSPRRPLHAARVHRHRPAHARTHAHRVHGERRQLAARQRPAHDHVAAHPQAAQQRELQREPDAGAESGSDFGAFVVVVEKELIFGLVVEVLVSLLVEPLDRADVSHLLLHADVHLREIVLDCATESLHSSAVEIGDHGDRREQKENVSRERGRDVQH